MGKAIGIDLGTTNSVVAILRRDRAETIENLEGQPLTPSVVGLGRSSEVLVGLPAKNQAVSHPENTIFSVKRFMGRAFRNSDVQRDVGLMPYKITEAQTGEAAIWLGGKAYSPPEMSAFILKALKEAAEESLEESVTHAVITVPAYFDQRQKYATRVAGKLAGLKVMNIIPEPTAAALAYGINADSSDSQTILVYDLGGGTFDVTVMLAVGGIFEDLAKTGDNHLGGDDFDQKIIDHIVAQVQRSHEVDLNNDRYALQKLKQKAEEAKIALSKRKVVDISIPALTKDRRGMMIDVDLTLTRDEYEQMIRPYVQHTIELVHQAIEEASFRPEDIQRILLVGGASLTPLVLDSLRREFGDDKIKRAINPMECVAWGAAVQTAIPLQVLCPKCQTLNEPGEEQCMQCHAPLFEPGERPPEVEQPAISLRPIPRTAKPLGIQTTDDEMEIIIDKGTVYPTTEPFTKYYQTNRPNQEILEIPVYEGFDTVASKNTWLGMAEGALPSGLPNGTDVAVSFSIDPDGIIYVTAQLPSRPDFKIAARIDMHNANAQPVAQPQADISIGVPPSWKEQAKSLLEMAAFTLNGGQRYLDPMTTYKIQGLGTELQQAIASNNETLGKRKIEELDDALNNIGYITLLVFAEALADAPDVSPSEQARLASLIQQAQRAMQMRNGPQVSAALDELSSLVSEIVERFTRAGKPVPGPGKDNRPKRRQ